ncbi:MAG TPA: hypothetical protein VL282_11805 [Tepidisphaeraceae bacterium]|jgi:hypothetical protein|nr:hypothetical protein [Tepidisphaeraceae bacterium]
MSDQCIVHGFIELQDGFDDVNRESLSTTDFDSKTFPNIFVGPILSPWGLSIAFAGGFNNFSDKLIGWQKSFESLLCTLFAKRATVLFDDESGELHGWHLEYTCEFYGTTTAGKRNWKRWRVSSQPAAEFMGSFCATSPDDR